MNRECVLLRSRQVSNMMSVSLDRLVAWRRSGHGPKYVQADGLIRYRSSDVENYIMARLVYPGNEAHSISHIPVSKCIEGEPSIEHEISSIEDYDQAVFLASCLLNCKYAKIDGPVYWMCHHDGRPTSVRDLSERAESIPDAKEMLFALRDLGIFKLGIFEENQWIGIVTDR